MYRQRVYVYSSSREKEGANEVERGGKKTTNLEMSSGILESVVVVEILRFPNLTLQ